MSSWPPGSTFRVSAVAGKSARRARVLGRGDPVPRGGCGGLPRGHRALRRGPPGGTALERRIPARHLPDQHLGLLRARLLLHPGRGAAGLRSRLAAARGHGLRGGLHHLLHLRVRDEPAGGNRVRGRRLIVTVSETDRWHGRPVYNVLLELFRHKGLAGATVSRGIAGFTGHGAIQTINVLDLSAALPVRVEVVDAPEAIDRVLADVYDIVERGLVEVQETQIVKFASGEEAALPEPRREDLMRLVRKAKLLRVHIGADDKWEGEPLHEAIVKRARQLDIAGATVYRGEMGYGAHKRLHRHKAFALSKDDPMMVAVIDTEQKIDQLLAAIDGMVTGGCLIAISDVTVVKYVPHEEKGEST